MGKKQRDARHLIGVVVHDGVMTAPKQHLHETSTYFMLEAWGDPAKRGNALPSNAMLMACAESSGENTTFFGQLQLQQFPESFLLDGIAKFSERYQTKKPRRTRVTEPAMILGIGRKPFCRSFVRYWANGGPAGDDTWEARMLGAVDSAQSGSVIWIDSKTNFVLQTADIIDMRAAARTTLGLPIN